MTIHFQLSRDDVRQLNREHEFYVSRRFSDPTPSKVYWYLFMPTTIVTVAIVSGSFLTAILAYGLIWGASTIGNRWHRARFAKNYYSDDNLDASLLPFQLDLLPDRLVLSNANLVHHHFWHSFRFLRETPGYFHLFFSPVSSMGVPKSAFHSEADLEAFRSTIKSHEPRNA
ncbi:MAG TPA: YcxB family protein [Chthoniobacterales bacterium]